eukprot:Protomagalhaensia_sp_Gyna_25__860@NODE_1415_length_1858_cov_109_268279_g1141_i0_p1_GENE_NODE_1415_length_1858_cov_109_268279_g1141_i0NODE_1415_length_1858_cov_109_268279_g1141_i0_p1_ORF_typecomplete_len274_score32_21Cytb5/PF00173_28/7_6e14_NODE_1415_length_1858_cov_109_268279_g1141_i010241845
MTPLQPPCPPVGTCPSNPDDCRSSCDMRRVRSARGALCRKRDPDFECDDCIEEDRASPEGSKHLNHIQDAQPSKRQGPRRSSIGGPAVIKLLSTQLVERQPAQTELELPLPSHRSSSQQPSAKCDACPMCSDRCQADNCRRCNIKLQKVDADRKASRRRKELPTYSICEVKRHNSADSLWVCANNMVYDATPILAWHPGGLKPILKKVGYDATPDFNFHTPQAQRRVWEPLAVGYVSPCPNTPTYIAPDKPAWYTTLLAERQPGDGKPGCLAM